MVQSRAWVTTGAAARYAKQLCSHADRMGAESTWTPPEGVVRFPQGGDCRLTAHEDALDLVVSADTAEGLATIQAVIGADLQRFGHRDGLQVVWTGDAPAVPPVSVPSHTEMAVRHSRR